jgi:DNA (cytosine-5)-methyltransferase 1
MTSQLFIHDPAPLRSPELQAGETKNAGQGCAVPGKLQVLDLFSGVGAYSLGLERTGGFRTVAFCEIEEYPRKILKQHWPHVPIFEDVRTLSADVLRNAGIVPQWIIAGWPCQDISSAGTGHGLDGARSGLWTEIVRLARGLGVEGLVLENSSNLLSINGGADFGTVLGDLASLGARHIEWHCLPAAAFDAPHIRDRLWIVVYLADPPWVQPRRQEQRPERQRTGQGGKPIFLADARRERRRAGHSRYLAWQDAQSRRGSEALADTDIIAPIGTAIARRERHSWEPEPDVGRVATGVADRVDRLRAIGNLNPPIVAETIGRAILEARRAAA